MPVTELPPLNLQNAGSFYGYQAIPLIVEYTNAASLMEIAQENNRIIYLTGWEGVAGVPYNFELYSGATLLNTMQFGANSGQGEPYKPGNPAIIANTRLGEALQMKCNQALPPFMMYVFKMPQL